MSKVIKKKASASLKVSGGKQSNKHTKRKATAKAGPAKSDLAKKPEVIDGVVSAPTDCMGISNVAVTIAQAREMMGDDAPTRDAFHKALKRGKLHKLPQQENERDFRFQWDDIVACFNWKGIKKGGGSSKATISETTNGNETAQPAMELPPVEPEHPLSPSATPGTSYDVSSQPARETMRGKPVLYRDVKTVITIPSEKFHEKLLCDGIILNLGDDCVFNCQFCYVPAEMFKLDKPIIDAYNRETGKQLGFEDVVIRRRNSLEVLKAQLLNPDGTRIYNDPNDTRVVYSSSLVDVAANMELLKETAEACNLIMEHTSWQVRLLSKSSLLKLLIERELIPKKYHRRLILGFSIGTLDGEVAAAIESKTSLVSKRLEALHWLQDHGIRTFGMICPSLPQEDYDKFSSEICAAIRPDLCEHVWAEVINVRGESLTKTTAALRVKGFEDEAVRLEAVSGSEHQDDWEEYARSTFLAHTKNIPHGKLRFLQYIRKETADWWKDQRDDGAVLLGAEANISQLTAGGESAPSEPLPPLMKADMDYLAEREAIVHVRIKAGILAAKALYEIKYYRYGLLWKKNYRMFEQYLLEKWGFQKSHGYQLVEVGGFICELVCENSANAEKLPVSEGQLRPLLATVPKKHRVECWKEIVEHNEPADLTGKMVAMEAKKYVRKEGLVTKPPKAEKATPQMRAKDEMEKFRAVLKKLPEPERFEQLLHGISILIDQNPCDGVIEVTASEVV